MVFNELKISTGLELLSGQGLRLILVAAAVISHTIQIKGNSGLVANRGNFMDGISCKADDVAGIEHFFTSGRNLLLYAKSCCAKVNSLNFDYSPS